jgi:hypothetical protein
MCSEIPARPKVKKWNDILLYNFPQIPHHKVVLNIFVAFCMLRGPWPCHELSLFTRGFCRHTSQTIRAMCLDFAKPSV